MNTTFEQLLRRANMAYMEGLHGLASYYVEQCKAEARRKPTPQKIRQAKKDSHNPFFNAHPQN